MSVAAWGGGKHLSPRAQEHLDRGLRYFNAQSYAEAIAEFKAGYALDPSPDFLYAMGQAERLSGDCKSAIDAYKAFSRAQPKDEQAELARKNQARCEAELASAIPRLTLELAPGAPEQTRVTLDGRGVEAAELGTSLEVSEGTHRVRVEAPHRVTTQVEIRARPGERQSVTVAPGDFLAPPELSPALSLAATPPGPSRALPWVVGGAGVAAVAAGGMVLWRANGVYQGLRADCGTLCAVQRWQGWAAATDASYALLAVGGAALATAGVLEVRARRGPSPPARLSWALGPTQVSAAVEF